MQGAGSIVACHAIVAAGNKKHELYAYIYIYTFIFLLSARKPSVQSCPFSCNHAIIIQSLTYAFHHTLTGIRREGMGWVGGWVGGIITFGTTYIMSLYHHHHIITQSSRHHHAISNLRKDIPMYIRMWQWRHWHSSQHASLLTLTSKALSKKRNE